MSIPISLNGLKGNEGWILAEPIRNSMGSILCPVNKPLDEATIEQLKKHYSKLNQALNNVNIKVKFDSKNLTDEQKKLYESIQEQNCDVPDYLSEELQYNTLLALRKTYLASEKTMADTLSVVNECIMEIAKRIQEEPDIYYSLGQYKNPFSVSNVFDHSLRVAQFAVALANIYNNNHTGSEGFINLKAVGTAALLHDYGVCFADSNEMRKLSLYQLGDSFLKNYPIVPNDLLQRPYDSQYDTVYAYSALKNFLDSSTLTMILLSRESENGNGSLKVKNDKTDTTTMGAKIIFLCNLYDSLLHHTLKNDLSMENVSAILENAVKNGVVNEELGNLFLDNIPLYSIGVRVLLSTGEYATVVERFKGANATKPVVKTLVNPPFASKIIDLRATTTITIQKIVGSNEQLADKINEITKNQLKTMEITSLSINDSYENRQDDMSYPSKTYKSM